jgi:hypothetical protein
MQAIRAPTTLTLAVKIRAANAIAGLRQRTLWLAYDKKISPPVICLTQLSHNRPDQHGGLGF